MSDTVSMSNCEWKEVTLGEISTGVSYGYTESANSEPVGPKFLRITDIANGRLLWDNVPYCPITKENLEKYLLKTGEIVIARTGATTGATYTIKQKDPKPVVFASYLIRYQIDKTQANPFFVDYVLRTNYWSGFVDGIKGGSAQPGANAKQFASFQFLLPPLPEQRAIASVLSSLDDKIDLLHRQNKTLEQMAETLFRQWFVEEAKEEWEVVELGDITYIKAGGDKPKIFSEVETDSCNIPIYSNGIKNEGLYGYTDRAKIITESITISARGTIGYVCLRQEPYFPIVRLISIIPNESFVSSKYMYLWAKSQNISGTGTTQQQLTVPEFRNTKLIIPPIDIMSKFTTFVTVLFDKMQFNKIQIRTLEKLRDTLLPKLMSGEVRVRIHD